MVIKKPIRKRGKIELNRYFQNLNEGDFVAVDVEKSLIKGFPKRLQGSTGKVKSRRGSALIVDIKTQKKNKEFIIHPVHLKKIKNKNDN